MTVVVLPDGELLLSQTAFFSFEYLCTFGLWKKTQKYQEITHHTTLMSKRPGINMKKPTR